jgi:hypothetical protein
MLGFQIRIRFDPDLFDWIGILKGVMAVRSVIFHARILFGIQVVANPPDLRFYIYGSTAQPTAALKRPIFKRKKGFANLNLCQINYSIA